MKRDFTLSTAHPGRPWVIALAFWLVLVSITIFGLWHLRRAMVEIQTRELGMLSLALTDEIDRGLRGVEEGLQAMRSELYARRLPLSGPDVSTSLRARADLMPLVRTLWLVDLDGRLIAASDEISPRKLPDFAPALLRNLPEEDAALSRPFAESSHHETLVAVAVRFHGRSGMPGEGVDEGGWILAALPSSTLLGAFGTALPAADARMVVLRGDGVRLASSNMNPSRLDEAGVAQHLADRPSLEVRRTRDGRERLVGLHDVPRYDIKVVVSRDLSAVLLSWHQTVQVSITALALLLVVMVAATCVVQRADRRRTEAQLALQTQVSRASKLESLGTLAGSVAHDFNNVLASILGYGEMAQDAVVPDSDQARHLEKMVQAALRGKALVERILAFSRSGARSSTVFELEPVVEEVLTMLAGSLRPGIVLERRLDAPKALLRGDATQAFEAVMNLCTNALQAMPGGGMLSVQTDRVHVAAPRVLSHSALPAGRYVALTVADQGGGITPAVMEHLFEPFFTTRAAQSGTGLGLAVVHGVAAEFRCAIDVQSLPGQGARFILYFPEHTGATGPAHDPAVAAAAPGGAGQCLLVVDDDPVLVAMTEDMLRGLGYAPVGFTDPVAALRAFRDEPQRFAGVVTDELMPGLTGTGMTRLMLAVAPGLPVLLVSGHGGALMARRAADAGVRRVLGKPLQRAELATALAELLQ